MVFPFLTAPVPPPCCLPAAFVPPWAALVAFRILAPQAGLEPVPSAVAAQSPNHWTAREFPAGPILAELHTHSDPAVTPPAFCSPLIVPLFHLNKKSLSSHVPGRSGHTYLNILYSCVSNYFWLPQFYKGAVCFLRRDHLPVWVSLCLTVSYPTNLTKLTIQPSLLSHGPGFQKHTDPHTDTHKKWTWRTKSESSLLVWFG